MSIIHPLLLNFNSIKVRLEPELKTSYDRYDGFQFHKGTIRTKEEREKLAKSVNFNSIKVRLELFAAVRSYQVNEFQFHKGTIRTHFFCSYTMQCVISIP